MKIIITASNFVNNLYFSGYTDKLTEKGLGSGALTGTNRVPLLTKEKSEAKPLETFIDAKRTINEILDAIRYEDLEEDINFITIHLFK